MNSIVFISNQHVIGRIGGAEVQSDILASSLAKLGWSVVYLTRAVNEVQDYKNYKLVPSPVRKNKFKELLSELNADIYYQRGRQEFTEWVGEFCKETGKKFVFAASSDSDCITYKKLSRNSDSIIKIVKYGVNFFKNINLDKKSLWGMRQADLVLSQTYFQKKAAKDNLGIESHVFHNVHNLPALNNNITKERKMPIILWLANIKERKQPEIFLKLVRDMKEVNCKFLMAGMLRSRKYEGLLDEAKRINKNFEYLGNISFEKSNALLSNADIFLSTSNSHEGFPNTFIQSWLHGVPTLSLGFDPDDLIVKEKLGIVANNNYTKLKELASLLIHNKNLRKEYSENAKFFSRKTFNIDKNIEDFIELILYRESK